MSKKLAIKGHATRGKEVIELLQMMGGHATVINKISNETDKVFFISDNENCFYRKSIRFIPDSSKEIEEFNVFTLEEFLEKYPFKIGDKVVDCYGNSITIKSMEWLEDLETMVYAFEENSVVLAAKDIRFAYDNTTPAEETITPTPDITTDVTDKNNCGIQCPDGYEFYDENGNLIGTKVMMRPKKPKYPKTYEECCKITEDVADASLTCFACNLLNNFQKLLLCRDAYWEIAGEQMGLGKPWEPKFGKYILYSIKFYLYQDSFVLHKGEYSSSDNCILVFPTEEMRDAFYENFKDLIEQCKELL